MILPVRSRNASSGAKLTSVANKRERHDTILEIIGARVVSSQEDLRKLLLQRGWDVTQATLSRDLRELRLARVPTPEGARYAITDGSIEESRAALDTLLPSPPGNSIGCSARQEQERKISPHDATHT